MHFLPISLIGLLIILLIAYLSVILDNFFILTKKAEAENFQSFPPQLLTFNQKSF